MAQVQDKMPGWLIIVLLHQGPVKLIKLCVWYMLCHIAMKLFVQIMASPQEWASQPPGIKLLMWRIAIHYLSLKSYTDNNEELHAWLHGGALGWCVS